MKTRPGRKTPPLNLLLAILALLPGCVLPDFSYPVEIASVTNLIVVDLRTRPESARRLEGRAEALPAVMITFATTEPLRRFMAMNERMLHFRASLCDDGRFDSHRRVTADSQVYDSSGPIEPTVGPLDGAEREARAFVYVATPLASRFADRPDYAAGHDLRIYAADICFVLVNVRMFGLPRYSASVVIPYPAIRAALDAAGM